jgi:hypothetical protein
MEVSSILHAQPLKARTGAKNNIINIIGLVANNKGQEG